jgi:putative flippase GtrA
MQFARYFVSGCAALGVQLAVLEGLLALRLLPPVPSSAVGFVLACAVNFTLQRQWVFRSERAVGAAGLRYVLVTAAMLGVNVAIFALLDAPIGLPPWLAQSLTTASVFILNFFCNRRFTFAGTA